jgi:hypothetical protein
MIHIGQIALNENYYTIEAVMVGTAGTQGISFVSPGRVISK